MIAPTVVSMRVVVIIVKINLRRKSCCATRPARSTSVYITPLPGCEPGVALATTRRALLYLSTLFPENSFLL